MIRFTIPPGALVGEDDELVLDYDDDRMMLSEARILEKATGSRISEIHREFLAGGQLGVAAYVWLAMIRTDRRVKFSELDFDMAKIRAQRLDEQVADEDQGDTEPECCEDDAVPPTPAAA